MNPSDDQPGASTPDAKPLRRRRTLLRAGAGLAGLPIVRRALAHPAPSVATDPFTLGVASGYPHEHGMVLWTRLAPQPDAPHGGMDPAPVAVRVSIARDRDFAEIVHQETAWASAEWAHSLHVEVDGLTPDTWYWYRFELDMQ